MRICILILKRVSLLGQVEHNLLQSVVVNFRQGSDQIFDGLKPNVVVWVH